MVTQSPTTESPNLAALMKRYQKSANGQLEQHASRLRLPVDALQRIGCGVSADGDHLMIPMFNADRTICGLQSRHADGTKKTLQGGHNGLFLPVDMPEAEPVFITEGASDLMAALDLGLAAIGRHNCTGTDDKALEFLRKAAVTNAVVIGDNDEPGRMGAEKIGKLLADASITARIIYPPASYKDLREWYTNAIMNLSEVIALADAAEPIKSEAQLAQEEPWEAPIELGAGELPAFPVDCLPPVLRDMIMATSESLQVDPAMPAMLALAAVSFCMCKRVIVNPKPGHIEQPGLYVMTIADPGNKKSKTLDLLTTPIHEKEAEVNLDRSADISRTRHERDMLDRTIENKKKQLGRGDDDQDIKRQVLDLVKQREEMQVVTPVEFTVDDITPEKLGKVLKQNRERLGVFSAEGSFIDVISGRYTKGVSNLNLLCQAYTGDRYKYSRINDDSILVLDHPCMALGLLVQPDVLRTMTKDGTAEGRGLNGRFLYSFPASRSGDRQWRSTPIPDSVAKAYSDTIRMLLDHDETTEISTLKLDRDAENAMSVFHGDIQTRLRGQEGDLCHIRSWAEKIVGTTCRIAAVLHAAKCPHGYHQFAIEVDSSRAAIRIATEYLVPHALAAFHAMKFDPDMDLAERIIQWLKDTGKAEVSKRDIHYRFKASVQGAEDLDKPLNILMDRYIVRPIPYSKPSPRGGRPSPGYAVNPAILKETTLDF